MWSPWLLPLPTSPLLSIADPSSLHLPPAKGTVHFSLDRSLSLMISDHSLFSNAALDFDSCHRRRVSLLRLSSNGDSRTVSDTATSIIPSSSDSVGTSPPLRVVFSGTDDGSHIYSSIAIADSLSLLHPNPQFLFLSPPSPSLSSTIIPSAGYTLSPIPIPFLSFSLLLPIALIQSTISCLFSLSKFKPHIFVGTGGYLSLPAGIAACILGIKVVIQEQNSYPGIESRILGSFAERIFLGFNGCVKYFRKEKCMVYGNPVRVSLKKYTSKAAARMHFFPNSIKKGEGEAQV